MSFIGALRYRHELLFWYAVGSLMLALICLVLARFSSLQVLGTSAWYKPFKFFASTAIFVSSMAWYLHYLPPSRMTYWYPWVLVVLFTIENSYILWQASRGLGSHFNVSTSFHSFMWGVMGLAAVGISVSTLLVAIPFFTQSFPTLPPAYLWGIRMGLVVFVLFSLEGIAMGARMSHTVGAADGGAGVAVLNWSKTHGDLRIAHFLGMHALQLLPLIGFFLIRHVPGVLITSAIYLAITIFSFVQAMQGRPWWKL